MKHGAGLETSLQPSLYRLHQLFLPLVADTPTWLHVYYMESPGNHAAGHAYIPKGYNIACDTMFVCISNPKIQQNITKYYSTGPVFLTHS